MRNWKDSEIFFSIPTKGIIVRIELSNRKTRKIITQVLGNSPCFKVFSIYINFSNQANASDLKEENVLQEICKEKYKIPVSKDNRFKFLEMKARHKPSFIF